MIPVPITSLNAPGGDRSGKSGANQHPRWLTDYDDTVPGLVGDGEGTGPAALGELPRFRHRRRCRRPSRQDAEKKSPPEGLALTSKFLLTKNENLVALGTRVAPTTFEYVTSSEGGTSVVFSSALRYFLMDR